MKHFKLTFATLARLSMLIRTVRDDRSSRTRKGLMHSPTELSVL